MAFHEHCQRNPSFYQHMSSLSSVFITSRSLSLGTVSVSLQSRPQSCEYETGRESIHLSGQ